MPLIVPAAMVLILSASIPVGGDRTETDRSGSAVIVNHDHDEDGISDRHHGEPMIESSRTIARNARPASTKGKTDNVA